MRRSSEADDLARIAIDESATEAQVPSVEPLQIGGGVLTTTPTAAALSTKPPPFFRPHTIQGQLYDLSHLDPFSHSVVGSDREYAIEVRFSCHCFTEEVTQNHTPDLHYTHRGERRAFCTIRHQLSIQLPQLITTLKTQSVYNNRGGNFFFWRNQTVTGQGEPYLIFFDATRSTRSGIDVIMNINSAHLKPGMTLFAAPVKFPTLIEAKTKGTKLRVGPAQQIKRK